MAFVQIMEMTAPDIDAVRKANDDWERATEGKRTARRLVLARDRDQPDHYVAVAFFDSYESAMENSALPETQAAAERYRELTSSITYRDLDVLEERL